MKRSAIKQVFKELLLFVLFFLLAKASVGKDLRVFSLGFGATIIMLDKNSLLTTLLLVGAEGLATFKVESLICSCILCLIIILGKTINKKIKLKNNIALNSFYFLVGCLPYFFIYYGASMIASCLVFCVLSCGVFIASSVFIGAFISRKSYLRFNLDEIACGLIVVIGLFCGLYKICTPQLDLVRLVAPLILLITCYIELDSLSLSFGTVFGIGTCLAGAGIEYISLFCVTAMMIKLFKSDIKLFSALACVCVDIIFGLYFNVFTSYTIYNTLAVIISGGIFMLLPKRFFDYMLINYSKPSTKMAYRNLINENNIKMSKKLNQLSEVFFDIDIGFRKLVRGELPLAECKKMFVSELIEDCCRECENYKVCHHKYAKEIGEVFCELADAGFEKGKINLLDLSPFLTVNCLRINVLLSQINALINQFKKNNKLNKLEDDSKILIAEQIRGVSKLLYSLSKEACEKLVFDTKKEVEISEELGYNDIVCSEVAVYQQDKNNYRISMVVRNEDFQKDNFIKSVEKICKQKLVVTGVEKALINGLIVVNMESAPKYDIVFGVAKVTKDNGETSGDNYSLIRLNNNKFLMAICDGMGSGVEANKISDQVAGLIENFYKAYFDSEIILNSINRLINIKGGDNFSTIDICNIDLSSSIVDFIKLGAVCSYIKHKDSFTKIESGALPVGVLDDISPKITKTSLSFGDIVILISDGVVDCLGEEVLEEYISSSISLAPQELADNILDRAKQECKGVPIDDMTVLVGKVFKNI